MKGNRFILRSLCAIFLFALAFFLSAAQAANYCATYDPGPPLTMAGGETRTIPVKVTNCGTMSLLTVPYVPSNPLSQLVAMYYHFECTLSSGSAIMPNACSSSAISIEAGKSAVVDMSVTAPNSPGTHLLSIDIVGRNYASTPVVKLSSQGSAPGKLPMTIVQAIKSASAVIDVSPSQLRTTCPAKATVKASITADGRGTVTYHLDAKKAPTRGGSGILGGEVVEYTPAKHSIFFEAPGTKEVAFDFPINSDFAGELRLEISQPGAFFSKPVQVGYDCAGKTVIVPGQTPVKLPTKRQ